jgi:hypothetical protein
MFNVLKISLFVLVIIIFLVFITAVVADIMFNKKVNNEIKELFSGVRNSNKQIIQQSDIAELPNCLQKWLVNSGIIGKEKIETVRLKQKIVMKMKPDGKWTPQSDAVQYFTIEKPAFIWKTKIYMMLLLYAAGRDMYFQGKGNMLIKLLSIIPIADSRGKEIDQGTMLRYLAEVMWFPSAALSNYIKWEEVDSTTAKATMKYEEISASGIFKFNENGDILYYEAMRYGEFDGKYSLEKWHIDMTGYKSFNGIRIPNKSDVTWKLKSGDWTWLKLEITEIEYNKPEIY